MPESERAGRPRIVHLHAANSMGHKRMASLGVDRSTVREKAVEPCR
jgi:hypothetical protein